MATNYAITSSNGGTWTIQSTNSASVGRYHDLSLLMEGNNGNAQLITARPGVLPAGPNTGQYIPLALFVAATGTGLNLNSYLGAAVVERSSNVGSYLVQSRGTGAFSLSAADSTNPRVDRIDLQVLDGALGDNGGTSLTQIVVTTGVAAGSPVAPAAPTNSIPLATVLLPANTTTLTGAMITDKRKSAGLRGAVRFLLPGDALSDPGYMAGELRDTSAVSSINTLDRWNTVTSAWETLTPLGAGSSSCFYYATAAQTPGVGGALQFPSNAGTTPLVVASGTNNNTFTVQRAGTYIITAGARSGTSAVDVYLLVGGTLTGENASSGGSPIANTAVAAPLASGTAIQAIYGSSGATAPSGRNTFISIAYIGP